MFAATTTDTLSVADPTVLKKAPSLIPACLDLIQTPTSSSWSPDNNFLFISSAKTVHRYDPSSNTLKDVYATSGDGTMKHIVSKDKATVIVGLGSSIHVVNAGLNSEIIQTFDTHKDDITSICLSNDNTLLASTSLSAIHVHNLALGSHTVLRGLAGTEDINTSIFHPHTRSRLLVASGKQLLVYDTTRPSGPIKTFSLADSASGDILAVACSPFSKTLVAVATAAGFVGLMDLEKEKGLFRMLNVKTPLTAIGFSPEGAAVYLGTEDGKVLIQDLRALDKPPKAVVVSQSGSRIQTISVQTKARNFPEAPTKTPLAAASKAKTPAEPLPSGRRAASVTATARSASKSVPSPARPRTGKAPAAASPIARRVPSAMKEGKAAGSPAPVKAARNTEVKKVLSPIRDPHGNSGGASDLSGQLDTLANRRRGKASDATPTKASKKAPMDSLQARPSSSPRATTASSGRVPSSKAQDAEKPRRARTLPSATSIATLPSQATTRTRKVSATSTTTAPVIANDLLGVPATSPVRRPRAVSSASRAGVEEISAVSTSSDRHTRPPTSTSLTSGSRHPSSSSRPGSSISRTSVVESRRTSGSARTSSSRTPSPELPDHLEPITPLPASKQQKKIEKNAGMSVLGLGTPEVKKWIQVGHQDEVQEEKGTKGYKPKHSDFKGKGKTVGFKEDDDEGLEENQDDEEKIEELERNLSLQISWAALGANSPGQHGRSHSHSGLAASPGPSHAAGSSAHELLKTIVQDVMFDFQRESKAEMMGLHLDLLRMGRGWKMELRTLMDEYVGDLRDLREENERLRRENDKLRRD